MAVSMTKGQTSTSDHRSSRLQEMSWNDIQRPGAYLICGSGDLVRVPQDALAPGHSPLITITSTGETRVAKLRTTPQSQSRCCARSPPTTTTSSTSDSRLTANIPPRQRRRVQAVRRRASTCLSHSTRLDLAQRLTGPH